MNIKTLTSNTKTRNIILVVIFSIFAAISAYFITSDVLAHQKLKAVAEINVKTIEKEVEPLSLEVKKNIKAFTVDYKKDKLSDPKKAETLFATLKKMDFNTLIVEVSENNGDIISVLKTAEEQAIDTYIKLNTNSIKSTGDEKSILDFSKSLLAQKVIEGFIIDDYATKNITKTSEEVISLSKEIKKINPKILVGVAVNDVWANKDTNPLGSDTKADVQDLVDNFSDTKVIVQDKWIDFITLKNYNSISNQNKPFKVVSDWWNNVATQSKKPVITVLASSNVTLKTDGWGGEDEITRQYSSLKNNLTSNGIALNSLNEIIAPPNNWANMLHIYIKGEYKDEDLNKDLTMISPKKATFSTTEASFDFHGKFDPKQKVTINNSDVTPSKSGEFYEKINLNIGLNIITLSHKGKDTVYKITRTVKVLKSISPTGTTKINGQSELSISAVAYKGSSVVAKINKNTVKLLEVTSGDEFDPNSSYATFRGGYITPAQTAKEVSIGSISVTATYMGFNETLRGANVIINKAPPVIVIPPAPPVEPNPNPNPDPNPNNDPIISPPPAGNTPQVEIKTDYAKVWDLPIKDYNLQRKFSLPKGTTDYISSESGSYYILNSGRAIKKADANVFTAGVRNANNMTRVTGTSSNNSTILKFKNQYKSVFDITSDNLSFPTSSAGDYYLNDYNSRTITVTFFYTESVPALPDDFLANSNLFSSARWEKGLQEYRLILTLKRDGKYFGSYASYSDTGELTLTMNAITGFSGLRVFIDPGHGGSDPGATRLGVFEKDVTLGISNKLKAILESKGVTVSLTTEAQREAAQNTIKTLGNRVTYAQQYKANLMLSIHCNANDSSSAVGTETYYNSPFSRPLANAITNKISSEISLSNRGAKQGAYIVLAGTTFPSVLVETAFISNEGERNLLNSDQGQQRFAQAIANGITDYVN
jgi:N-acetylmuramoyl-L-alanine amidase